MFAKQIVKISFLASVITVLIIYLVLIVFNKGVLVPSIFDNYPNVRQKINNEQLQQLKLSSELSKAFLDYEQSIDNFIAKPIQRNQQQYRQASEVLTKNLNQAVKLYGLGVKRWVDIFKVWQVNFQHTLLTSHKNLKDSMWRVVYLNYQTGISDATEKAQQAFVNLGFKQLLYPMIGPNKPSTALVNKIKNIYESKAEALMPQAKQALEQQPNKLLGCLHVSSQSVNLTDPQSIAAKLVYLQYGSRYCSFNVENRWHNPCYTLQRISITGPNKQMLENYLALCVVAKQLINQEDTKAKQQYGHLSYQAYYNQFVKPLISKYKKQLEENAGHENANADFNVCEFRQQPVVNFRDPGIDAKNAAYEQYSYLYCHDFFKQNSQRFAIVQNIRYEQHIKNAIVSKKSSFKNIK